MKSGIRYLWLCVFPLLLAACGSAPTVKESAVLGPVSTKVEALQVVYRNVELKLVSQTSYGRGGVSIGNTGFDSFGTQVVKQAKAAFAQQKIMIVSAKELAEKESIQTEASPAGGRAASILVIAPSSGKIDANQHMTMASYVFSVILFDPDARRPLWKASIDTSAWSGQDFLLKNVKKTLYDEAYATQLLNAIAVQMRADGLI